MFLKFSDLTFGFLGVLGAVGALWEHVGARGIGRFLRVEMTSSFFFKKNSFLEPFCNTPFCVAFPNASRFVDQIFSRAWCFAKSLCLEMGLVAFYEVFGSLQ